MAIAGLDDILRRILGMQKQPNDDAGVFDAPGYYEGEMPPPTDYERQRMEMLGGPQQLLYTPGKNPNYDMPMIIPNAPPEDPNRPLRKGNAKYGSGIDI